MLARGYMSLAMLPGVFWEDAVAEEAERVQTAVGPEGWHLGKLRLLGMAVAQEHEKLLWPGGTALSNSWHFFGAFHLQSSLQALRR